MSRIWWKVLLLPPGLLENHARNYADLASQELHQHVQGLKKRCVIWALSAISGLLGVGLGGVAWLLWSALPSVNPQRAWIMLALPVGLCLLSLALAAWAWACRLRQAPLFQALQHQLQLDATSWQQNTPT